MAWGFNPIWSSSGLKRQLSKALKTRLPSLQTWHQKPWLSRLMWNIYTKSRLTCKHKTWIKLFWIIWNLICQKQIWRSGQKWFITSWTLKNQLRLLWLGSMSSYQMLIFQSLKPWNMPVTLRTPTLTWNGFSQTMWPLKMLLSSWATLTGLLCRVALDPVVLRVKLRRFSMRVKMMYRCLAFV